MDDIYPRYILELILDRNLPILNSTLGLTVYCNVIVEVERHVQVIEGKDLMGYFGTNGCMGRPEQ